MSESVRDLITRGVAATKAGEAREARRYLEWALRLDPNHNQCLKAWYWLSEVSDDPAEKRRYLDMLLSAEPNHQLARRSLAILDGRLANEDVINPDHLPDSIGSERRQTSAQRFVCPQCGGRLTFTPDGSSLTCEYCEGRHLAGGSRPQRRSEIQDFTVAMATRKGHTQPQEERSLECQSCGARLNLDANDLTVACPYCASVYVTEQMDDQDVFVIEQVIPFIMNQDRARQALRAWLDDQGIESHAIALRGFYLPTWAFSIRAHRGHKRTLEILIPASRSLPTDWATEIYNFDLSRLTPFDPGYLADWPAETYQVSLSDASLEARLQALERLRRSGALDARKARKLTSMDLTIDSFQLILLPFWIAKYAYNQSAYPALVNGQTGTPRAALPQIGLVGRLSKLLRFDDSG